VQRKTARNVNLFQDITLHLGLDDTYVAPAASPAVIRPGTPGEAILTIASGKVVAWHVVLE
jgi:hypothetical protein